MLKFIFVVIINCDHDNYYNHVKNEDNGSRIDTSSQVCNF